MAKEKSNNYKQWSNYNKKRHHQLLKYSDSLKKHGKSLRTESEKKYYELLDYSCLLSAHLDWETRHDYITLLSQILKKEISTEQFFFEFSERSDKNENVFEVLENNLIVLSPNKKALDFADLINEILEYGESLTNIFPSLEEESTLSEGEILDALKDFYLNIKLIVSE